MHQLDSKRRLEAIIQTAIDGIVTIDQRGIIDSVNPAAAQLFDYSSEELFGQNISMLMPEPYRSQHDAYLQRYLSSDEKHIIGIGREVSGIKKNGEVFPFRLAVGEIRIDDDSRIYTGIIHDLTEQKKNEEQLRKYAAELERSNRELENFAYVSSHDLQEPLRKIRTFGSRIQEREGDQLSEKGQDYLNRMLNASVRLQQLIDDLLAFSRVASRAKPFAELSLETTLEEVKSDLELSIQEHQARLEIGPLPTIEADRTQMRQLFQNLLSNAIKFRQEDQQPHIRIWTEPFLEPPKSSHAPPRQMYRIMVKDNGIGFDEKYMGKIFNIFQRLEGRKYPGSGIGLAICRKIALRHNGELTASSKPGHGATFTITLPAQQHLREAPVLHTD